MSPSWATRLKWFIFLILLSQILNLRFFLSYPSSLPQISDQIPITWSISYITKNAGVSFNMSPSWATCLKWFIFLIFLSQILDLRFFISYPSSLSRISDQIPITWSISYTIKNAGVPFHTSPSWATHLKWFIFSIFLSQILNLRFFISYPRFVPPISYLIPITWSISYTIKNAGVPFRMSPSWATRLKWFIFSIFLFQILNLRFFLSYPRFVPPISYLIPITWSISYTIKNASSTIPHVPILGNTFKVIYFLNIFNLKFWILDFSYHIQGLVPPISYLIPITWSISYTIKNAGVPFHMSPSWATRLKWFIFSIFLSQILNLRFFISYPRSCTSNILSDSNNLEYKLHNKKCSSTIPHVPILGNTFKVIYFLNIFISNFES